MNILMAIKRLEKMAGGAERVFLQVAEALHKNGHHVTIVTFDCKGADSFYPFPQEIRWIQLGIGNSEYRARFLETIKRIFYLRKIIKKNTPDVVIPFQHSMFVPVVFSMVGISVPVIASEHIVPAHYRTRPFEYFLLILASLKCKKITVLSKKIIEMYPSIIRSKMVEMPNPVVMSDLCASVSGDGVEKKTLLSVGRLDPQKDQKTLITAFAKLYPNFRDWQLKIIGEGHLRSELELQIKELKMEGVISLPGLSKDIMKEYHSAHAFVLASTYESFGLATAEAMSAGLPVVGFFDCAGTNELICDGKSGILVRINREETRADALARQLSELMSSKDMREQFGNNGKKQMEALSIDLIIERWENLIRTVCQPVTMG